MKYPAYYQYLMAQPLIEAAQHVFEGMRSGGEMAWDLLEDMNGEDWKIPEGMGAPEFIVNTIIKLHEKHGVKL